MNDTSVNNGTIAGTIGGTFTIFIANITTSDAFKTVVLSAIGAAVSFLVSLGMKRIVKRIRGSGVGGPGSEVRGRRPEVGRPKEGKTGRGRG